MSTKNRISQPYKNPYICAVTPQEIGEMPLEVFLSNYVSHHRQSRFIGPSYDAYTDIIARYLLAFIGEMPLKDLDAKKLRERYEYIYEWFKVFVKLMAGMNWLLEVAFDSALHRGVYNRNPAADLARKHTAAIQR